VPSADSVHVGSAGSERIRMVAFLRGVESAAGVADLGAAAGMRPVAGGCAVSRRESSRGAGHGADAGWGCGELEPWALPRWACGGFSASAARCNGRPFPRSPGMPASLCFFFFSTVCDAGIPGGGGKARSGWEPSTGRHRLAISAARLWPEARSGWFAGVPRRSSPPSRDEAAVGGAAIGTRSDRPALPPVLSATADSARKR